jgi:uncharacterized protein YndB with AHSA1/START domain
MTSVIDTTKFKPMTVYVIYIATTVEKVWHALTDPTFSRQYFFGFTVEVEPNTGGKFLIRYPDGRVHASGLVIDWSPPRHLSCTWQLHGMNEFDELPECLVTYEIEQAGGSVKVTMMESHSWNVPDAVLSGGRSGWPAVLSSLKSVLETGKPLSVEAPPPPEMLEAVKRVVAEKPWLRADA